MCECVRFGLGVTHNQGNAKRRPMTVPFTSCRLELTGIQNAGFDPRRRHARARACQSFGSRSPVALFTTVPAAHNPQHAGLFHPPTGRGSSSIAVWGDRHSSCNRRICTQLKRLPCLAFFGSFSPHMQFPGRIQASNSTSPRGSFCCSISRARHLSMASSEGKTIRSMSPPAAAIALT